MKPHLEKVRKREFRGKILGATNALASEEKLTHSEASLFEVVKELFGPDKFRCQDAETKNNGEPSRSGREDHGDAEENKREAEKDFNSALQLMYRLEKQRTKNGRSTFNRCIGLTPINLP